MAFIVLWLAGLAAWILAVVDAARQPPETYAATKRSKNGTVAVVIFAGWIGAIYYALVVRPALGRVPHRG